MISNELAQNKIEASEKILNFVLLKESEKSRKATLWVIYVFASVIAVCVIITVFVYLFQRKKKAAALHAKEEESKLLRKKINNSFVEVTDLAKKMTASF